MRGGHVLAGLLAMMAVISVLSWRLGYRNGIDASPVLADARDTVRITDTVTIELPTPVLISVIDTVLVADPEIVFIHDESFVKLPKESKEYSGKDYRAVVSGFQPSLDLIQVFPETETVTRTIFEPPRKSPRWSVGIQAGYGITLRDRHITPAPYIGLGVSYSLIQIPSK